MFHSPAERTYRYTFVTRYLWIPSALIPATMAWFLEHAGFPRGPVAIVLLSAVVSGATIYFFFGRPELQLHLEGIHVQAAFRAHELRWEEIRRTRYRSQTMAEEIGRQFGVIGVLAGFFAAQKKDAKKSGEWLIVEGDSDKLTISTMFVNGAEVIKEVLAKVNARLKPDLQRQLQQGQTVDFGDLHVQPDGVRWKNKAVVPYANLKEIGLKGSQFRIKADGKWLDYAAVASQKIPNLFVALELIEEKRTLAQRGALAAGAGALS